MKLITIDPGVSGGIAFTDVDGYVRAIKMPATIVDLIDELRSLRVYIDDVVIEKVGFHVLGNSATSSAKFARHCGHIEAICATLGFSITQVTPQKWMKIFGGLPKDKKQRKNTIKNVVQMYYPNIKVTLATSDALALMKIYNQKEN